MGRFLFIRIGSALPQLVLISILSFLIMKMAPGRADREPGREDGVYDSGRLRAGQA